MDKWRSYCSGIGICLILIAVIGICALHDQIYMWSLGNISDRYRQGMNAYREHDYDEARNRFIPLAGIDSASYAQYLLGDMYYRGLGGRVDYEKAFALFEKSGEAGNMNACNNLAFMYAYGHGVSENLSKAKKHFQYAAQQGNPQAQLGLGTLYRLGLGVQLDYRKAIQWYRRSASHGDSDAMNNLGYMFFNGLGVLPDVETALYWFGKSAAVDNPVA